MDALRVIADDLTGACDVGVELLPWPGGVVVEPDAAAAADAGIPAGALRIRNTQTRTSPAPAAAHRVAETLGTALRGWNGILLKKIDTGLRGQLGAELDAAIDALGADEAFVLPAIPEAGRTTEQGCQLIGGVPVDRTAFARDPHQPIRDASVPAAVEATGRRRAAVIGLDDVRANGRLDDAVERARRAGAAVLVCDAQTDEDLERSVRRLLLRARPLVLAGSTGLARALRRVLGTEHAARARPGSAEPPGGDTGVLVVVGSAHPAARAQVEAVARRGAEVVEVPLAGPSPESAGGAAARVVRARGTAILAAPVDPVSEGSARVLGAIRAAALAALARVRPRALAVVGGETAYHVLEGLGHPPLWLEARPAPLVVRSRLLGGGLAGLPVVTKGGSSGGPELLAQIVQQLARGGGG
jgi:uncharacterized protein YgbK (DUF1537 family)